MVSEKKYQKALQGISHQFSEALDGVGRLSSHLRAIPRGHELVITTDADGLKLPFELVQHGESNLSLGSALSRRVMGISRSVGLPFDESLSVLLNAGETLRVLLVSTDAGGELGKVDEEIEAIKSLIEGGEASMGLRVECVPLKSAEATLSLVESKLLNEGPFHILHIASHAEHFNEDPDASGMILRDDSGVAHIITCQRLRRWVEGAGLWLCYLSSCRSAAVSGSSANLSQKYLGAIDAVVSAGVPNVVGFRWAVSDGGAYTLATEFYRQVFKVKEQRLSKAMLAARRIVEGEPNAFDAWASAMLVTQTV